MPMENPMRVTVEHIHDGKHVIRVIVVCHQNGNQAMIAEEVRCFLPDWEPIEKTTARALRQAATWLDSGNVNLRDTGGMYYVARN
jgi:hypothetical protein